MSTSVGSCWGIYSAHMKITDKNLFVRFKGKKGMYYKITVSFADNSKRNTNSFRKTY
jgi:hypothetical protein